MLFSRVASTSARIACPCAAASSFAMADNTQYVITVQMVGDVMSCDISDGGGSLGTCGSTTSSLAGSTGVGVMMVDDTVGGSWSIQTVSKDPT